GCRAQAPDAAAPPPAGRLAPRARHSSTRRRPPPAPAAPACAGSGQRPGRPDCCSSPQCSRHRAELLALSRRPYTPSVHVDPATAHDQERAEQVAELFRNVAIGVLGAAFGAVILAAALVWLGGLSAATAALWAGFICVCAGLHLGLRWGYLRHRPPVTPWRAW